MKEKEREKREDKEHDVMVIFFLLPSIHYRSEDNSRIPSGVGGMGRDSIRNFLDRYQTLDGYIISQVPAPMEKEISFPPFLTCGSLAQGVQVGTGFLPGHTSRVQ